MIQQKLMHKVMAALLISMSFFIFPTVASAAETANPHVAPPTVTAEITGSLLKIHATAGFFGVEAVYINDRRFNYRVDSSLMIDISGYIASGDLISVYAVDFAGNHSNTVLLTPPIPQQPPPPNNLTPEGQGEILDRATGGDNIEFLTITARDGNVFHLIIDHTRNGNNVYFLNTVTEWDLINLANEAGVIAPPQYTVTPPPEPIITESTPEPTPTPETEMPKKSGGGAGRYIFLVILGIGGFGAVYYLKILKPKKDAEMYQNDGDEDDDADGDFEEIETDDEDDYDNEEDGGTEHE